MPQTTITLSSVGTSPAANLNWRGGKATTLVVASSGTGSSAAYTVEYSLDDSQTATSVTWFGVSSNPYALGTAGATTFGASLGSVYIPMPGPIAAARINCSSNSGGVTLTMRAMQGDLS
jgi:hypothetical protein